MFDCYVFFCYEEQKTVIKISSQDYNLFSKIFLKLKIPPNHYPTNSKIEIYYVNVSFTILNIEKHVYFEKQK